MYTCEIPWRLVADWAYAVLCAPTTIDWVNPHVPANGSSDDIYMSKSGGLSSVASTFIRLRVSSNDTDMNGKRTMRAVLSAAASVTDVYEPAGMTMEKGWAGICGETL